MFWYSHLFENFPQFVVIHRVKGFGIVNKADIFLELCCFSNDAWCHDQNQDTEHLHHPQNLLVDFVLILTFKIQNISITPCFSNNQYTRHLCSVSIAWLAVEFHMDGSYAVIYRFLYFKTENPFCHMYQ